MANPAWEPTPAELTDLAARTDLTEAQICELARTRSTQDQVTDAALRATAQARAAVRSTYPAIPTPLVPSSLSEATVAQWRGPVMQLAKGLLTLRNKADSKAGAAAVATARADLRRIADLEEPLEGLAPSAVPTLAVHCYSQPRGLACSY